MLKRTTGTLVGIGFLLGATSGALAAQMPAETTALKRSMLHLGEPQVSIASTYTQFRHIEQPLGYKLAVTLGGLGLISLELWWFLLSKPKSQKLEAHEGVQEVTITVDGGYEPSLIIVQAGQLVKLNFFRRDPSSCLEEVRLPDFHIAQNLPLNEVTTVEFTPIQSGSYEFTCGMNMFRGTIEVQPSSVASKDLAQVSV